MLNQLLKLFSLGKQRVEDILPYPEGKRIYREFHPLRRENMDQDALKVINRLNRHGYRSFLVGGCVRDMILGKRPKDYDVVTTATPSQIRKVFSNSRIIGRRFKIVHVIFHGKVIEVSTFRSLPGHRLSRSLKQDDVFLTHDNEYGTPREDAARRDFTINALYFDVRNESLIDYVNGFEDIGSKIISVIGDPGISFREDPVRMLRAAKFAALLDFEIDPKCVRAIKKNKHEIKKASLSRMVEEYIKIFRTGRSFEIFASLADTGLLHQLFPEAMHATERLYPKAENFRETGIGLRLASADKMLTEREDLTTTIFFALLFADLVIDVFNPTPVTNVLNYIKQQIDPLCRKINLSGKDRDRLIQIFISQFRFYQRKQKKNADTFRNKVFFYEAFMVFKIQAIISQNEEAIQKAMFWEIGPRAHPPDPGKMISMFHNRRNFSAGERKEKEHGGSRGRPRRRRSPRGAGSGAEQGS